MRRKDDKRKLQRDEKKARKVIEKERKKEELKRLKNMKREEILKRLQQIQDNAGAKLEGVDKVGLEEDFDPDAHDKRMKELFNEEFYDEGDDAEDLKKPNWVDEDGIDLGEYDVDYNEDEAYAPMIEGDDGEIYDAENYGKLF